ncbi:MAG TPA: DUF2231 domain-containing protein [Vicinamibacterales bacterium]|nr:DUF2231 domain-containing protein [Vicinamibacterales bacterium]
MESRAKLFGHPVHPMLIVFPLGLFIFALLCDVAYLTNGDPSFASAAYWNIVGGIVGGLLAAVFGTVDWLAIPNKTRAKAIGLWHGLGNVVVVALFAVSWYLRYTSSTYGHAPSKVAVALSFAAVALGGITSWLGGELVDRLGVGVDDGAHLNAPNSLSGRPARG